MFFIHFISLIKNDFYIYLIVLFFTLTLIIYYIIFCKEVFFFSFKIRLSKITNKKVRTYRIAKFTRFFWKPIFKKNMYSNFLSDMIFWKI